MSSLPDKLHELCNDLWDLLDVYRGSIEDHRYSYIMAITNLLYVAYDMKQNGEDPVLSKSQIHDVVIKRWNDEHGK